MIGVPMPHPKDAIEAHLNQKLEQFFGAGGKAQVEPGAEMKQRPARSEQIDPDTVLKRRRPSPTQAERIALRRIAESL
ncbi:hypothetical protein PS712_05783 [Pseudomonas fluorescens]|uniref:Uncharacterized protein n=1 Tax=Pseudomonas fluorescens TaxID=294 RepID=A0A5E7FN30_PSEFL|nr:hypothetical protein [Pseudomonas fluorescens]VVO40232.1 hypothetical protein PS712_05783 [Pseudomonas fluorescens]